MSKKCETCKNKKNPWCCETCKHNGVLIDKYEQQETPFQEWNEKEGEEKYHGKLIGKDFVMECRKEGWNAAIKEAISGEYCAPSTDLIIFVEQIKKMIEP